MCLVALAFEAHPRFPLVVAANRDEFFDRAAAPLHWWPPRPDTPKSSPVGISRQGAPGWA